MYYLDVITILHGMSLSVMVQTTASMMGTYCYCIWCDSHLQEFCGPSSSVGDMEVFLWSFYASLLLATGRWMQHRLQKTRSLDRQKQGRSTDKNEVARPTKTRSPDRRNKVARPGLIKQYTYMRPVIMATASQECL